jgi:CubicO group peptidase (beta-lactamase class C family)
MKRTFALTALFLTFCVAQAASAQPLPLARPAQQGFSPERLKRVQETVERAVDEGKHAGAVWLIARNGRVVDWQACGYRDLESRSLMERNSICRIYSMSKIVTSAATLILLEEGKIALDDPVGRYLPELSNPQVLIGGTSETPKLESAKSAVTIKHLLTHTSGYLYDFSGNSPAHQLYKQQDLWNSGSLKEFVNRVAKLPLAHHPGEKWTYGINNDILGALIEVVSGQSFEEFLQQRIFGPLNMRDTAFHVPAEKTNRLARTYSQGSGGKLVEGHDFLGAYTEEGRGIASGGAGLFSTAGDFARFAQMLLDGGELDGKRILSRKSVELMTANHLQLLPVDHHNYSPGHGWGLGVEVRLDLGRGSTLGTPGQFGWYGAATTYCQIDPKEKLVAVLFTQHFPFNQHGLFGSFANAYYQALD